MNKEHHVGCGCSGIVAGSASTPMHLSIACTLHRGDRSLLQCVIDQLVRGAIQHTVSVLLGL
jgi:hypothetical protein